MLTSKFTQRTQDGVILVLVPADGDRSQTAMTVDEAKEVAELLIEAASTAWDPKMS